LAYIVLADYSDDSARTRLVFEDALKIYAAVAQAGIVVRPIHLASNKTPHLENKAENLFKDLAGD
jgi:hypothetical protein